ncbi:MAG: DUF2625 family protein [Bacillota bacterium]|nr:DUF2625 family protein [Bacillota bacterium]
MKTIKELLNTEETAWPMIVQWLNEAKVCCELLERNQKHAEGTLVKLQVTTKSTLGSVAYMTGGIWFDCGWFRLLGSGNGKSSVDLLTCNGINDDQAERTINGALIVAIDVLGGIFAINGGAFEGEMGNIFYFAPDTFQWEDLDIGYTDFIHWLTLGKLDEFYSSQRWEGWQQDVAQLKDDEGFGFYPPLWSAEGSVSISKRFVVPIKELLMNI